jgi:hypothetical protein
MIDPIALQMLRDVVTIFGVIVGLTYYVMTVRHQNKTRNAQNFSILLQRMDDVDFWSYYGTTRVVSTQTYEEREKAMREDPNLYGGFMANVMFFQNVGWMVKQGLIDISMVEENMRMTVIGVYEYSMPAIEEYARSLSILSICTRS